MKKISAFLFILFLASCGYQPIFLNNNPKNFEFQKINFAGDNDINKKIIHQRPHFMYNNVKTTSLYNCDNFIELKEKISNTTVKNNHIISKRK